MDPRLFPIWFGNTFNLTSYMGSQSDGLFYQFPKTDDSFQESTGPTAASAAGNVIGLKLDRRLWSGQTLAQVVAAATEINSNPGNPFVNTTGYVAVSCTVSVVGGRIRLLSTISGVGARVADIPVSGLVVGKTYGVYATAQALGGAGALTASSVSLRDSANLTSLFSSTPNSGLAFGPATATTGYVRIRWDGNASTDTTSYVDFDIASLKLVPGHPATQPTSGNKPTWQTGGWSRYDGIDDYHSQSFNFGAAGLIMIRYKLLQKTASTQVIFGSVGVSGTDRAYFGNDASGYAVGRVGNGALMSATADRTNTDGTIGIMWDGTEAHLIVDGAKAVSQTQVGAPTTTIAPTIGGYNNNGTPGSFCNADVREIVAMNAAQNANKLRQFHNALMAL